ncbi:unnamed protein product [Agarophyton chilense]
MTCYHVQYGKVEIAIVVRDLLSGECHGLGFVKKYTNEASKVAIKTLPEFEFDRREISLKRSKRKASHQRMPGAYMRIDRQIRDIYAGIKMAQEHDTGYVYGEP